MVGVGEAVDLIATGPTGEGPHIGASPLTRLVAMGTRVPTAPGRTGAADLIPWGHGPHRLPIDLLR